VRATLELVLDCSDPQALMRFWREAGKNRMHVDIISDDVEVEVGRLEALGARRLHDGVQTFGPTRWVTMADPEDNEFCVSTGVEW
jgi:predicted enzyme related to lactoylglutathione lyase